MKKQFFTAAMLLLAGSNFAQVSAYGFTQTSGTYGSAFSGTYIGNPLQDDDVNTLSIPFNFTFNGSTYNTIDVCSNGYAGFAGLTGTEYNPISDNSTTEMVSPFGQDLWMGLVTTGDIVSGSNTITNVSYPGGLSVGDSLVDAFGDFNSMVFTVVSITGSVVVINTTAANSVTGVDLYVLNGALRENVAGTTPNRIYTVEFRNFARYGVHDESLNFKMKLYETSNKIEFVYGPMHVGNDTGPVEVGLKGSSNSDYKTRQVGSSNTWATSSAATSITDFCDVMQNKFPVSGQTYIWAPSCVAPTLAIVPSATVTCGGQPVVLVANGNATTYTWTGSGSASQITVTPNTSSSYTLTGTANNCTAQTVYNHSVAPTPTVSGTVSSGTICSGSTTTLTASGATSYTWINVGSGITQAVTPTASTTYTVIGESGGCTGQDQVAVTVNQGPAMQITQSHTMLCTDSQQSGTLTASGANSYNWSNGSLTAQIVITPSGTTSYTVTGTGSNGCTSTKTITQQATICGGLAETNVQHMLRAFPNPFQNTIVMESQVGKLDVKVIDITGRVIFVASHEGGDLMLSTESWKPGLYFIEASNGTQVQTLKMVKQ